MKFLPRWLPHGRHRRLPRTHYGRTYTIEILTLLASPLDMMGLMGMAQVIATIAYGIQGLRRGQTTWDWPTFLADPEQENREQMHRWSLNEAPSWSVPLAIANKYHDLDTTQPKRVRYRLILALASDLGWLRGDRLKDLQAQVKTSHGWISAQQLPFDEIIYMQRCRSH